MPMLREDKRDIDLERKELAATKRKLEKEKDDWRTKKSGMQREAVRLKSLKDDLGRQTTEASSELAETRAEIALAKDSLSDLKAKNTDLELENHRLEEDIATNRVELATVTDELEQKKTSIDTELDAYSLEKKKSIKEDILSVNQQLTNATEELATARAQVEQQRTELRELNQVYIDEQDELKASSAETKRMIAENQATLETSTALLKELQEKVSKAQYEYDNTMIAVTKAREEHDKFIDYEKNARKILETKDRQLQKSAADIATEGQFVKNQRSFLPPM